MQPKYSQAVGEQLFVDAVAQADRPHQDEHVGQQTSPGAPMKARA
ncbi:hypothetical protein [Cryobacterium ruanii]|nr:hypothetical protein [Cryobacterium ruanii]